MSGQSYEFSAKTVDAAIAEGLQQLGVSRDQIDVEILHPGSRGILGIGASNARIRITLRPQPEPVLAPENAADAAATAPAEAQPLEAPGRDSSPADRDEAILAVGPAPAEPERTEETPSVAEAALEEIREEAEEPDEAFEADAVSDEELADLAHGLLAQLLHHMGIDADIEVSWPEDSNGGEPPLNLNIVGKDLGGLIGRRGETLSSIQYLVRLMVNQEIHRWTNIVVDVDGYKERRAERLEQMAHRLAEQVAQTGKPVALEPMPANERRLVHIALRNHPAVYTESTGEDVRRKVQILPK